MEEIEIKTEYINIQTDFGFKHVFGTLKNKDALIRFLNALFEGSMTVKDITYHDKEILPSEEGGKRIVYDVYCTAPVSRASSPFFPRTKPGDSDRHTDHHFILEMQNIYTPPFEERMTFYASKMVAAQGKAGWNYELEPVFAVAVTDFNFSHLSPKTVRDVMLADRESGEQLTDKLHIILCSLKEVPQRWEECRTEMEHILFLIKNMDNMDSTSLAYREGRFPELFEASRSSRLRKEEIVAYSQSLEKLRDTQLGIQYAAERAAERAAEIAAARAREEGLEKGRAEGREEGETNAKLEIARKMLREGMGSAMISSFTGLSVSEIESL